MSESRSLRLAKKYIRKEPLPSSLETAFRKKGMEDMLDRVYIRTAELIDGHGNDSKARMNHLQQVLPCIAFYEVLIENSGSRDEALSFYGEWVLKKVEKIGKFIPVLMKIPGLYRLVPGLFDIFLDKLFGEEAGFVSRKLACERGFAADVLSCPYADMCRQYDCFEIVQYFCKSDDIIYGNIHPKLQWKRTQTIGNGAEICDFRMYIDK